MIASCKQGFNWRYLRPDAHEVTCICVIFYHKAKGKLFQLLSPNSNSKFKTKPSQFILALKSGLKFVVVHGYWAGLNFGLFVSKIILQFQIGIWSCQLIGNLQLQFTFGKSFASTGLKLANKTLFLNKYYTKKLLLVTHKCEVNIRPGEAKNYPVSITPTLDASLRPDASDILILIRI